MVFKLVSKLTTDISYSKLVSKRLIETNLEHEVMSN